MLTSRNIRRIDGAPGGRHYQVEGFDEPFPSVTTVLGIINKTDLAPWPGNTALESAEAALMARTGHWEPISPEWVVEVIAEARRWPDQVRTEGADFGTRSHVLIDQIIQGLEPEIPPEMASVVRSFTDWREGANLDIRVTETVVYSAKYRYAGAMDALARRDGELVALDWKPSNGFYPEYALQVAAYAKALEEMTGKPVTEAWTARFGKVFPEFTARKVVDLDAAFNAFRAALYLWRAMRVESRRGEGTVAG